MTGTYHNATELVLGNFIQADLLDSIESTLLFIQA